MLASIISFILAIVMIAVGVFLLRKYYNFKDKLVSKITKSGDNTFTVTDSDGISYKVEKIFGLVNPPENVTHTLMLDKTKKVAYVVPFDLLDYRYTAGVMLLIGVLLIALGVFLLPKKTKDVYMPYETYDAGYDAGYDADDDGYDGSSCYMDKGLNYAIYGM